MTKNKNKESQEAVFIDFGAILAKPETLSDEDKASLQSAYDSILELNKAQVEELTKADAEISILTGKLAEREKDIESATTTITALKQANAKLQSESGGKDTEISNLKSQISNLTAEIEALKITGELGDEEGKLTVDKKGVWTVKGHKYSFKDGIKAVFIQGKKTPVEEALKNEAYLAALAENKAIIIKKVD